MTTATQKPSGTILPDPSKKITKNLEKQIFYLPEKKFFNYCNDLEKLAKEVLLRDMRLDRDFYKKVLEEPHREKKPSSYRYLDAQIRINILNINGKTLKQLIK